MAKTKLCWPVQGLCTDSPPVAEDLTFALIGKSSWECCWLFVFLEGILFGCMWVPNNLFLIHGRTIYFFCKKVPIK